MNLDDLTPAGAGSLRDPYRVQQAAGTFTRTELNHDELWQAARLRSAMRPGHGLEHEPLDSAEKAAEHTAQDAAGAFDLQGMNKMVRSALRPGA